MRDLKFTLTGEMPSKKNNYKRGAHGRLYIPENVQGVLDDFLWQLKKHRQKKPFTGRISLYAIFYCKDPLKQDGDNMGTTLQDLLQKAGVIENDKFIMEWGGMKRPLTAVPQPKPKNFGPYIDISLVEL
jgi:Holliday junction resolvase RusA-like endonuclease